MKIILVTILTLFLTTNLSAQDQERQSDKALLTKEEKMMQREERMKERREKFKSLPKEKQDAAKAEIRRHRREMRKIIGELHRQGEAHHQKMYNQQQNDNKNN